MKTSKKLSKKQIPVVEIPAYTPPTPEELAAYNKEAFERFLVNQLAEACEAIERFSKELNEHPSYALEWAQSAFQATGVLEVVKCVLINYMGGAIMKDIYELCLERALSGANHPSQSTSVTRNLASTYMTAAWADMAGSIKQYGFLKATA